jgi:hypothetical protein
VEVVVDRPNGDHEPLGDLAVREPAGGKRRDFLLGCVSGRSNSRCAMAGVRAPSHRSTSDLVLAAEASALPFRPSGVTPNVINLRSTSVPVAVLTTDVGEYDLLSPSMPQR